jgi:hypothetical protein
LAPQGGGGPRVRFLPLPPTSHAKVLVRGRGRRAPGGEASTLSAQQPERPTGELGRPPWGPGEALKAAFSPPWKKGLRPRPLPRKTPFAPAPLWKGVHLLGRRAPQALRAASPTVGRGDRPGWRDPRKRGPSSSSARGKSDLRLVGLPPELRGFFAQPLPPELSGQKRCGARGGGSSSTPVTTRSSWKNPRPAGGLGMEGPLRAPGLRGEPHRRGLLRREAPGEGVGPTRVYYSEAGGTLRPEEEALSQRGGPAPLHPGGGWRGEWDGPRYEVEGELLRRGPDPKGPAPTLVLAL